LNLYHLTVEFLGYLRRVEGVPYSKGELGRRELHRFILERHDGRLEHRESMLESAQRGIDCERLDQFLAGLLGMWNQLYYCASALFEIIPAWLLFLEGRRLIDAEVRAETLRSLAGLANSMRRVSRCIALNRDRKRLPLPLSAPACRIWPS